MAERAQFMLSGKQATAIDGQGDDDGGPAGQTNNNSRIPRLKRDKRGETGWTVRGDFGQHDAGS